MCFLYLIQVTVEVVQEFYSVSETAVSIRVCARVRPGDIISGRSFQVGYLTGQFGGATAPFAGNTPGPDT